MYRAEAGHVREQLVVYEEIYLAVLEMHQNICYLGQKKIDSVPGF